MNGRPVAVNPYPKKPGRKQYRSWRTNVARGVVGAWDHMRDQARKKHARGWPAKTIARKFGMEEADIRLMLRTDADDAPRLVRKA